MCFIRLSQHIVIISPNSEPCKVGSCTGEAKRFPRKRKWNFKTVRLNFSV
jgi:hypothetical protein